MPKRLIEITGLADGARDWRMNFVFQLFRLSGREDFAKMERRFAKETRP